MRGRKKNDQTRAAILKCAAEVFSRREFHEVLTDEIALELGMGKGTIYRYFESKEVLYFEAIASGLESMHEAVAAELQEDTPLEVSIERVVRRMLEYFWSRRDFFLLLTRMEPKLEPSERQRWQERREHLLGHFTLALQRELSPGAVGRAHSRVAVEMLFGMIRSVCLYRQPSDTVAELSRLITHTFLHGIATPPSEQTARARPKTLRAVAKTRREA